jgi:DNA modification methylase
MVHLTEKPVELARRSIEYSTLPGERVLDLFGGSGSTLIAAEMTGRRALLMEIDPLYCDVIVQRWERFTGARASLATANAAPIQPATITGPGPESRLEKEGDDHADRQAR